MGQEVHRWGAGMRMGPGARSMRGVKGSQMRWVAGRTSEQANGSVWLGRRVCPGWVTGGGWGGELAGEVGELEGAVG